MNSRRISLVVMIFTAIFTVSCGQHTRTKQESAKDDSLELISRQHQGIDGDFYIKDGSVYIPGSVVIKNNTDEQKEFSIIAFSEDDYRSGLLKSPVLQGFDEKNSTSSFVIDARQEQNYKVIFVGENGDYDIKKDRLLPYIYLVY